MTANASAAMNDAGAVAARTSAAGRAGTDSAPPNGVRRGDAIRELKKRDNYTNFAHIGFVYLVIIASVAATIWSYGIIAEAGLGWWWNIPMTLVAIVAVGASQHQFGGVIHEATHFILFENRKLNELISDWLAAFPIYTSTFHFRLHHLAHHQFINDPVRDPDFAQLHDSGHDLDFPITHIEMLQALLKQIWLPNLFRYTLARARYSALGTVNNPYVDRERRGERLPTLAGIIYAVGVVVAVIPLVVTGHAAWAFAVLGALTPAIIIYYALLDENKLPHAHVETVISHRTTNISRVTYMAIVYTALTGIEVAGWAPAWIYYVLLWIVPLFTTFPLFMIMRQWVQHGNADRGRYTNTRVFLVNPLIRYAVFPFGMDYHLPHHIYASVPHYKLKGLHDLLLQDPEYREKGVVVEGYFNSPHCGADERNPTVLEVLGVKYAPHTPNDVFVDTETLEYADVKNPDAIKRENEASAVFSKPTSSLPSARKARQSRRTSMKITACGMLAAATLIASALSAQGQAADPGVEFAFMPSTMTVTLLNEGGKYVAVDMKHIAQGATCRMDKDAIIARVGAGASAGTTRVRYAAVQVSPGGCPFLTTFDLPDADYAAARAAFVQMKDDGWKKVDDLKKQLGDKWDEVTGAKK